MSGARPYPHESDPPRPDPPEAAPLDSGLLDSDLQDADPLDPNLLAAIQAKAHQLETELQPSSPADSPPEPESPKPESPKQVTFQQATPQQVTSPRVTSHQVQGEPTATPRLDSNQTASHQRAIEPTAIEHNVPPPELSWPNSTGTNQKNVPPPISPDEFRWREAHTPLQDPPEPDQHGVPRRFRVLLLLAATALMTLPLVAFRAFGLTALAGGLITLLILVIGVAQAMLFRGKHPREASTLAGLVAVPPLAIAYRLLAPAWIEDFTGTEAVNFWLFFLSIFGFAVGYLVGLFVAGTFWLLEVSLPGSRDSSSHPENLP